MFIYYNVIAGSCICFFLLLGVIVTIHERICFALKTELIPYFNVNISMLIYLHSVFIRRIFVIKFLFDDLLH